MALEDRKSRLIAWAFFSVGISLLPFLLALVLIHTEMKVTDLLKHGELILIAVALASDALGELLLSRSVPTKEKLWTAIGCVVVLVFGAAYYANMVSGLPLGSTDGTVSAIVASFILFVISLASSGRCKWLTSAEL